MGTELKTPENCENTLRNRKQKNTQNENSEKSLKDKVKHVEKVIAEKSNQQNKDEIAKIQSNSTMRSTEDEKQQQIPQKSLLPQEAVNFIIKIEFDPMSIALFILALATRFFRLSEPKNVV